MTAGTSNHAGRPSDPKRPRTADDHPSIAATRQNLDTQMEEAAAPAGNNPASTPATNPQSSVSAAAAALASHARRPFNRRYRGENLHPLYPAGPHAFGFRRTRPILTTQARACTPGYVESQSHNDFTSSCVLDATTGLPKAPIIRLAGIFIPANKMLKTDACNWLAHIIDQHLKKTTGKDESVVCGAFDIKASGQVGNTALAKNFFITAKQPEKEYLLNYLEDMVTPILTSASTLKDAPTSSVGFPLFTPMSEFDNSTTEKNATCLELCLRSAVQDHPLPPLHIEAALEMLKTLVANLTPANSPFTLEEIVEIKECCEFEDNTGHGRNGNLRVREQFQGQQPCLVNEPLADGTPFRIMAASLLQKVGLLSILEAKQVTGLTGDVSGIVDGVSKLHIDIKSIPDSPWEDWSPHLVLVQMKMASFNKMSKCTPTRKGRPTHTLITGDFRTALCEAALDANDLSAQYLHSIAEFSAVKTFWDKNAKKVTASTSFYWDTKSASIAAALVTGGPFAAKDDRLRGVYFLPPGKQIQFQVGYPQYVPAKLKEASGYVNPDTTDGAQTEDQDDEQAVDPLETHAGVPPFNLPQ